MSSQFAEFTQPGQKPVVNSIFDFSAEALGELRLWLEQNPPAIGISNVLGFSQFTAQASSRIGSFESTTSTSYTDLATVGPTLTGLPDGKYLVILTCVSDTATAGNQALMSVSVNAAAASDSFATQSRTDQLVTVTSPSLQTLSSDGNNTLTAKYRSDNVAAAASFGNRQIFALRYANK